MPHRIDEHIVPQWSRNVAWWWDF